MSQSLYLARIPQAGLPAMLVIAKGHGAGGTTACRSVLILPSRQSAPILREFDGPAGTADDATRADEFPDRALHRLALEQATRDATEAVGPVAPGDFKRTAWSSLLRWIPSGKFAREALTAAANHIGNMDGSGRLRAADKIMRRIVG